MDIITRAEAGLPKPPSTLTRHTGSWPGITWHHTGGSYTTWRAIYDWQVIQRPVDARLPYIGYSYGIARGRVTELRGWDYRPAGDHDNDRLQVCFMGTWDSKLPPAEDLAAAVEFLAWAEARNGKPLPGTPHRDVWPAGHRYDTDCPGDALTAWVTKTLPTLGDDMTPDQSRKLDNVERILTCFTDGRDPFGIKYSTGDPGRVLPNPFVALQAQQAALLAAVKGDADAAEILAGVDERLAQLRAGIVADVLAAVPDGPVTREDLVAALTQVLGSVDEQV